MSDADENVLVVLQSAVGESGSEDRRLKRVRRAEEETMRRC